MEASAAFAEKRNYSTPFPVFHLGLLEFPGGLPGVTGVEDAVAHDDTNTAPDGHARPLWAPWRMDYICGPRPRGCFLCEKGRGEGGPADHVVARGQTCFVLLNDYPYNSGHLMVAPYRHIADIAELTAPEQAEFMRLIIESEDVLKRLMSPDGFNVGFNIGAAAGAGVRDHVHGHLVPRWVGDTNFMPVIGDARVVPQSLDDTARLIKEEWGEG